MIILLNGLSRCGKDTVARYLHETYNFEHIKISKKVKEVVSVMFDIPKDQLEDDRKDSVNSEYNVTPRDIMKFIGTHVGQYELNKLIPHMGRSFWICSAIKHMHIDSKYVISDYRFPHEYDSLKKAFPSKRIIVVKIKPQFQGFISPKVIDETELQLNYDYILVNDNISQLHTYIDNLINTLKK